MPSTRSLAFGMTTALAVACTPSAPLAPPEVPISLEPPQGSVAVVRAFAKGAQLYECRDGKWAFVSPSAELFDEGGDHVGQHGAGPSWALDDGSRVVGSVVTKADSPKGAVPWLLLRVDPGKGSGQFARVTAIQRVDTVGGVGPTGTCVADAHLAVPYSATYYFYAPRE
jgi:Protein of unknown function (DUF3455)